MSGNCPQTEVANRIPALANRVQVSHRNAMPAYMATPGGERVLVEHHQVGVIGNRPGQIVLGRAGAEEGHRARMLLQQGEEVTDFIRRPRAVSSSRQLVRSLAWRCPRTTFPKPASGTGAGCADSRPLIPAPDPARNA